MTRFATLYDAIDRTTSTNAKVAAMVGTSRGRRLRTPRGPCSSSLAGD